MSTKTITALVTTALMLASLTACTAADADISSPGNEQSSYLFNSPQDGYEFAVKKDFDLMAQILEDGEVTREEYQTGFEANLDCRTENGWQFDDDRVWNPLDRLRLIVQETPPEGTLTDDYYAAEALCSEQFEYISYLFQTTALPTTEPQLLAAIEACLAEREIEFAAGTQSVRDALGTEIVNDPDFDAALDCVTTRIETLYPTLIGYSIAL